MPPLRRATPLLLLTALMACDHVTKYAAKAQLEGRPPRSLIHSMLELRYVENTDVAFNILRWVPERVRMPFLVVFGALAIGMLVLAVVRHRGSPGGRFALLMILAGALGNYADRLARGYVVDFIHVTRWPVFNAADIFVTVGISLVIYTGLRPPQPASAAT
jgi:signal peptidase II